MSHLPALPYRGLKSFRYIDRDIFAGRGDDVEKIYNLLLQFRGIMLFGPSGIGKSSLIAANLLPELYDNAFAPEIIRINPDEEGTFVVSRIKKTEEDDVFFPSFFDEFIEDKNPNNKKINVSFSNFKNKLELLKIKPQDRTDKRAAWEDRSEKMPVFIFDQFEEFVTLFEEDTENCDKNKNEALLKLQDNIVELLKQCYFTEDFFVKIVFVFREDYLAKFGKLFNAIPDLRDHYLRIKALKVNQLAEIIKRPFDTKEKKAHFKSPFSETLIDSLEEKLTEHFKDGKLILTEVQIVCLQLFNVAPESTTDEERIKYLEGQTVNGILENFYIELLKKLGVAEYAIAVDILSLLVLNEKTRNVLHEDAILETLQPSYTRERVKDAIKKLEHDINIIRVEERQGGTYYEIVSEAIIPDINKKKIEKEREKIIRKKQKRIYRIITAAAVLLLGFLAVIGHKAREQQKREQVKLVEKQWYQKIPDDVVREGAIDLLVNKDTAGEEYKKNKTLLAMLAGSYYYSMLNRNSEALAITYFAKKGLQGKNKGISTAIEKRINEFMLPKTVFNGFNGKRITDVFNGYNGNCFYLLSDNSIHILKYKKDSIVLSDVVINDFVSPLSFNSNYLRMSANETRFSGQNRITITRMISNSGQPVYIIYNNAIARYYDESMKLAGSINPTKKNILAVLPYGKSNFILIYDDGQYEKYIAQPNRYVINGKQEKLNVAGRAVTNLDGLTRFYNKDFFIITQNTFDKSAKYRCKIEKDGFVNVSALDPNTRLLDVNKNAMHLLRKNDGYYVKNERTISTTLSADNYSYLLNDTNLLVAYRYNKVDVYKVDTSASRIEITKQSEIKPMPENIYPEVYSRKNIVVIKSYDSYLLYNLKTQKRSMLVLGDNSEDDNIVSGSAGMFINDSIFTIVKRNAVLLYNVDDLGKNFDVTPAQDSSLRSVACKLLMFNDDIDQNILESLFPQEYLKGSLENATATKNYSSAIGLARKLLSTSRTHADTLIGYSSLYTTYNNLLTDQPNDTSSVRKQIEYCNFVMKYADTLMQVKKDSSYFFWSLKRKGGLAWYQIVSGQYDTALKTAQEAISMDKKNEQQWINTNLALAYLFTGQTNEAIKVYQKWKGKYFNDDAEKASVRFMEDIESLQKLYNINIPKKDTILSILRS